MIVIQWGHEGIDCPPRQCHATGQSRSHPSINLFTQDVLPALAAAVQGHPPSAAGIPSSTEQDAPCLSRGHTQGLCAPGGTLLVAGCGRQVCGKGAESVGSGGAVGGVKDYVHLAERCWSPGAADRCVGRVRKVWALGLTWKCGRLCALAGGCWPLCALERNLKGNLC